MVELSIICAVFSINMQLYLEIQRHMHTVKIYMLIMLLHMFYINFSQLSVKVLC